MYMTVEVEYEEDLNSHFASVLKNPLTSPNQEE